MPISSWMNAFIGDVHGCTNATMPWMAMSGDLRVGQLKTRMKKALCVSKGLLEWESSNDEHGCSNADKFMDERFYR
ncbi:hypothetical protein AADZ86_17165 [Colwelliaceae bacterium BS250]